jgi:leader peptidase (prepilin peptidase)/N-methyltransferase
MTAIFALLGLLVGGLINQLGSDLPARRRLTYPHCPYCGQERPKWQWLATPAFVVQRMHCPACGAAIGWRHPLVEIGLAAAYGYLWITFGPTIKLALYLVYAAVFALILVTDLERRLILNVVTFPAIAFAIVASVFDPDLTPKYALIGGAVGFVFFRIAAWVGNALFGSGALGEGDVTLATFVGLITGYPLIVEAIILTIVAGAVISFLLLITRIRSLRDPIPYGPFLVIGAIITLLWGYPIAEWFLYR